MIWHRDVNVGLFRDVNVMLKGEINLTILSVVDFFHWPPQPYLLLKKGVTFGSDFV